MLLDVVRFSFSSWSSIISLILCLISCLFSKAFLLLSTGIELRLDVKGLLRSISMTERVKLAEAPLPLSTNELRNIRVYLSFAPIGPCRKEFLSIFCSSCTIQCYFFLHPSHLHFADFLDYSCPI